MGAVEMEAERTTLAASGEIVNFCSCTSAILLVPLEVQALCFRQVNGGGLTTRGESFQQGRGAGERQPHDDPPPRGAGKPEGGRRRDPQARAIETLERTACH